MISGSYTLKHANSIFKNSKTETEVRACASRAYFGLYQHLLNHSDLSHFEPAGSANDHQRMGEALKQSSNQLYRQAWRRFRRLRILRNRADYDINDSYPAELAREVIETANEMVFDWLPADDDM